MLRCFFPVPKLYSPKEYSLGVIFFIILVSFLMFAKNFLKIQRISLLIVLCMIVYVTINLLLLLLLQTITLPEEMRRKQTNNDPNYSVVVSLD